MITSTVKRIEDNLVKEMLSDANFCGKILSKFALVKDDSGYWDYNTLTPAFKKVENDSELAKKIINIFCMENMVFIEGYSIEEFLEDYPMTQVYSDGDFHCAWFSDGDTYMLFICDSLNMKLINDDFKKDYTWRFIK